MKTYTKTITTGEQSNTINLEIDTDGKGRLYAAGVTKFLDTPAELADAANAEIEKIREYQLKSELKRTAMEAAAIALGFALSATTKD